METIIYTLNKIVEPADFHHAYLYKVSYNFLKKKKAIYLLVGHREWIRKANTRPSVNFQGM